MMIIRADGGLLLDNDTCKETVRRWTENGKYMVKKFKYKLLFDWHFRYLHLVENHNNLSHSLPSIEYTWMNDQWECWGSAFILAVSQVNALLILCYFFYCGFHREIMPTLLEFCWKL